MPPKGDKTRLVPIPVRSFTGYALREAVLARVEAALAEQTAGTNPEALLFPAAEGVVVALRLRGGPAAAGDA